MTQPTPYRRSYSFTDYQAANPAAQAPGPKTDAELDAVSTTLTAVLRNLALIQRDDGGLANASVGPDTLSASVLALIASGAFTVRGAWVGAMALVAGDMVSAAGIVYLTMIAHTATSVAADVAAGKLVLVFDPGNTTLQASLATIAGAATIGTTAGISVQAALNAAASAAALAASTGAALIGAASGSTLQAELNARTVQVADRTALKALNTARNSVALLLEGARYGAFRLRAGAPPISDPQEGIYVVSNTASFYWERDWDGTTALAEWFGAVAGSALGGIPAANVTAIHAALAICPVVKLLGADYYTSTTIKHNYANTELLGAGSKFNEAAGLGATRLILGNGTQAVLHLGPDSSPGAISTFKQGVRAKGIFCTRSVAPVVASACSAVIVQFLLEAYLEDIVGYESMNGFVFNATVHCYAMRCAAHRVSAGSGGTDFWRGFYVLGTSGITAGGNASLYLVLCHADDNRAAVVNGVGFYADGKFTDCYWLDCETASCTIGMEVNGNAATTNDYGSNDLIIANPINDACKVYGIYVHAMGVSGSVNITDPYVGLAVGATGAIELNGAYGVRVTGGQIPMGVATAANAIRIENSRACDIDGTVIMESTVAPIVTSNITAVRVAPILKNMTVTGAEAVQIVGTASACKFEAIIDGKENAGGVGYGFTHGYRVVGPALVFTAALAAATSGTLTANWTGVSGVHLVVFSDGSVRDVTLTNGAATATWAGAVTASDTSTVSRARLSEFNCSGINSACLNGGSGKKFMAAETQITTAYTASGTNMPTGVMT